MSETAPSPPVPPPRRRSAWRTVVVIAVLVVVALIVALALGAWWILGTSGGARLVLGQVQGLLGPGARIEGIEGRIGGLLTVRHISLDRPDVHVELHDVALDTAPFEPLYGRLLVRSLDVREIDVRTASTGKAATLPASIKPPYPVRLDRGHIGTLRFGHLGKPQSDDVVLHDIALKGEGDRSRWHVEEATAQTAYGLARVAGTLGNAPPFAVEATADFAGKVESHALHVAGTAKGTLKALDADLDAQIEGMRATARAAIEPLAEMPLKRADVAAREVDLARLRAGLPATRLAVQARVAPRGDGFAGPVRIENADPGPWDRKKLPFERASAEVAVASDGRTQLSGLEVALAGGGGARGSAIVENGTVDARLEVNDVDLAALDAALQKTRMTGRVTVEAAQQAQRFSVALTDPRFAVEGRGALANQKLDVETVNVRTKGGSVTASGSATLAGAREFRFEGRAQHFDPSAFVKTSAGDLNFTFRVAGTAAHGPAGEAHLDIAPSRYAGLPASGRVFVRGDRTRLAASDIHLAVGDGRVDAQGSLGRAGDALEVAVHAPNLSTLVKPFGIAASGRVDAQGRIAGTFRSPAVQLQADAANLALPSNVFVHAAKVRAQLGARPDSPVDIVVNAQGVALGKDTPPTPFAQALDVAMRGTRGAHRIELTARMTSDATLATVLQGGLDPRGGLAWSGRVQSLSLTGRGAFTLAAPATLAASADRVELGDALLTGTWGEAHFAVSRWTPKSLDFQGSSRRLVVQNLARSLELGWTARSDLVIAGDWDIRAGETFDGRIDFHRTGGDVRVGDPAQPLGLRELSVGMSATRGRTHASAHLVADHVGRIDGEGSGLIVRGSRGWRFAENAPIDAKLVAAVPELAALGAWLGPDTHLAGAVDANITVGGTGASPRVAGQARAHALALREPQTGFELEQGEALLRIDGRALTIEALHAVTPWHPPPGARTKLGTVAAGEHRGTITAEGGIDFAAHRGTIRVKAAEVPVTQLPQRFVVLSGDARLEATGNGLAVTGALKADAGWVGALETPPPSVAEDVVVVRAAQPAAPAKSSIASREPITLDVTVDGGDHLYFEGRGLDTRLTGRLHVTGVVPALRADGSIRTIGGSYNGYGQKLHIERGVLQFAGPIDNPRLDVRAMRTGLPVEAGVDVLGTAAHPRVRLVSVPDVPEPEKLSWLVLGRAPSDLGPGDASVLVQAASSMLGKGGGSEDIAKRFGFDEVGIGRKDTTSVLGVLPESTVAGRTGTASAAEVVTVGRRITDTVHLTYQQGLSDAEGTVKIAWQATQRFQVIARAGYLPGLDFVYRWLFP